MTHDPHQDAANQHPFRSEIEQLRAEMNGPGLPSTPAIRRITLNMLRQKLETAEAAGLTGIQIGTGHLRLILDSLPDEK